MLPQNMSLWHTDFFLIKVILPSRHQKSFLLTPYCNREKYLASMTQSSSSLLCSCIQTCQSLQDLCLQFGFYLYYWWRIVPLPEGVSLEKVEKYTLIMIVYERLIGSSSLTQINRPRTKRFRDFTLLLGPLGCPAISGQSVINHLPLSLSLT